MITAVSFQHASQVHFPRYSKKAHCMRLCKVVFETLFTLGLCWAAKGYRQKWQLYLAGRQIYPIFQRQAEIERQQLLKQVQKSEDILADCDPALLNDRAFMLEAAALNGYALAYACDAFRGDKEIVLRAVKSKAEALKFANDAMRADKDVVLAAVAGDGEMLMLASDVLRKDKQVVLATVARSGYSIRYAADKLQFDKDVALMAASKGKYLSSIFILDPDVRKAAGHTTTERVVSQTMPTMEEQKKLLEKISTDHACNVLNACPIQLLSHREFMKAAIKKDSEAYIYASDELREDRSLAILKLGCLESLPLKFRDDIEFVQAAMKTNSCFYTSISDRLKGDPAIAQIGIDALDDITPEIIFSGAPENIRGDKDTMMVAAKKRIPIWLASDALRKDKEYLDEAIKCFYKGNDIRYASESYRNNPDNVFQAITNGGGAAILYASHKIRTDREYTLNILKDRAYVFPYVHKKFKDDEEVVALAAKQLPWVFDHASDRLKNDSKFVASLNLNQKK